MDFYIDIHAHSTLMNGFMYGNVYEDITRYERQAIFPKLLCQNAEDFSLANTNFNRDSVKAGTGRRYVSSLIAFHFLFNAILYYASHPSHKEPCIIDTDTVKLVPVENDFECFNNIILTSSSSIVLPISSKIRALTHYTLKGTHTIPIRYQTLYYLLYF